MKDISSATIPLSPIHSRPPPLRPYTFWPSTHASQAHTHTHTHRQSQNNVPNPFPEEIPNPRAKSKPPEVRKMRPTLPDFPLFPANLCTSDNPTWDLRVRYRSRHHTRSGSLVGVSFVHFYDGMRSQIYGDGSAPPWGPLGVRIEDPRRSALRS